MRNYSLFDNIVSSLLQCIRTVQQKPATHARANPSQPFAEPNLDAKEMALSANLMRINHTGEVCAQALYLGQGLTTQNPTLKKLFSDAALEEADHLHWCETRIKELNSHTSYLNPLWFAGSFMIGATAGMMGKRFSLGFLAETENQVFAHLSSHLQKLPPQDIKSRKIVEQMRQEEAEHAATAMRHGGSSLPLPIKETMRFMAKVMTNITFHL